MSKRGAKLFFWLFGMIALGTGFGGFIMFTEGRAEGIALIVLAVLSFAFSVYIGVKYDISFG